jgi:hypothetical protein
MLTPHEDISYGLHLAEGIESALTGYLGGLRPTWAMGSASAIAKFRPLSGVECLSIFTEKNDGGANEKAIRECAPHWLRAGCEVTGIDPVGGDDLNDLVRGAA